MLHDDVIAWTQLVKKAVQSVSEHAGAEYNSLVQQIDKSKVCQCHTHCTWGPVNALDWCIGFSAIWHLFLFHHSSSPLLLSPFFSCSPIPPPPTHTPEEAFKLTLYLLACTSTSSSFDTHLCCLSLSLSADAA